MKRVSAVVGTVLVISLLAVAANAADVPPCGPRTQLVQAMKQMFDERPQATGLISTSELFELFVSPAGTWTILVTKPSGISCIAAAGENWDERPGELASRLPTN